MASGVSKLIPSDPEKVMVINPRLPNLMTLSTPFNRFGRIKIGGRGTLVKLADESLAVFSPVALTGAVKTAISENFGSSSTVRYIVALDQEHHIFLESWHKEYPQAKIVMPETLPGLRDKQNYFKLPQENWVLFKKEAKSKEGGGLTVDPNFDSEFDMEYVDAHVNKELVFNHRPTRTLIEADLLFNLPCKEQYSKTTVDPSSGLLTKLFCSLNGIKGDAIWQKRMIWYLSSSGDRAGFSDSMARIAKWDFDRLVPCHGDVIETGGKGVFEKVMEWHLKSAKKDT